MFTGIIETIGTIRSIKTSGTNREFEIESDLSDELKIDQSVAHNGVCLTVTSVGDRVHTVVAIDETLKKSNLGMLKPGGKVNLERCMLNNGRFDGHIVQGHVDQVGHIRSVREEEGSWLYTIEYAPDVGNITVEKGSVTVNGISLTCFDAKQDSFKVAIIPYTYEHTNLHELQAGDTVNLEFDIIGKYVQRLLAKAQ